MKESPQIRAHDFAPVAQGLQQADTLRSVKQFFEDMLTDGAANADPRRLYAGVCDALGEPPKPGLSVNTT